MHALTAKNSPTWSTQLRAHIHFLHPFIDVPPQSLQLLRARWHDQTRTLAHTQPDTHTHAHTQIAAIRAASIAGAHPTQIQPSLA
jgi:hypothetical protein